MVDMRERPVCHRAEDLVSYLYGEASAAEAHDFAEHMRRCDSCRAEFASFKRAHESITVWRNEALGSISYGTIPSAATNLVEAYQPSRERMRSARAALQEFFAISPLWLRGVTAFATVSLCLLAVFAVSQLLRPATQIPANSQEKVFTKAEFHDAVNKEVEARMNQLKTAQPQTSGTDSNSSVAAAAAPRSKATRIQLARRPRTQLTPQEREQLAADLRLIPGRDDALPFVFSDEPEQ